MRRDLTLAATLLLGLGGCVAPPGGYGPAGYGYTQPAYPGAYPGTAYGEGADVYPGYNYNAGTPSIVVEGASQPLVYFGGSWGYYDGYRRFRRAPDSIGRHLESRHPGGYGARPYVPSAYPRPEGPRFGDRPFGGRGYERPLEGPRYEGPRPGGDRPFGGRGFDRLPEGQRGGYQPPPGGRFGGPAFAMPPRPEGRPGGGGPPPGPRGGSMGVSTGGPPPPRPAAPPPQARQGGSERHCNPGQPRC